MTDPFHLEVSPAAQRQLRRLPPKVALAVVEFITVVLPENPLRLSKPLTGQLSSLRSARRGDYRVLIEVNARTRRILVVRVAHRSAAYRPPIPSDERGPAAGS